MKLKKMILLTAAVLSLAVCPSQLVSAAFVSNPQLTTEQHIGAVSPLSDNYVWTYKVENGKLYKRLYNSTDGSWIGPWIYVCEYPE